MGGETGKGALINYWVTANAYLRCTQLSVSALSLSLHCSACDFDHLSPCFCAHVPWHLQSSLGGSSSPTGDFSVDCFVGAYLPASLPPAIDSERVSTGIKRQHFQKLAQGSAGF
jgi:hypothetical protein